MQNLAYVPPRSRRPLVIALAVVLAAAAWPATTHARRAKVASGRAAGNPAAIPRPAPTPLAGKIVVFPFQDDDDHSISAQVERLLRARGFEIVPGVRPVDTPEQYRELATTLGLAALVGGSYREGETNARLTIQVRSGYTGRQMVAVTFKNSRLHLRSQVEGRLWTRIAPAMTRACADASRPRKRGRRPLFIEAGTPLASSGESTVH
ncbi:MAG TPA: hypothetical protein VFH68_19450 [Polyangia bacterium]|jgi:hypothetical protein|nr:hypothetical protein [Polyangia bacterium]